MEPAPQASPPKAAPSASLSVAPITTAGEGAMDLDECLCHLGRTTESLLRTMRLDVVVLGSRDEEMRSILRKLEEEWHMLEMTMEKQKEIEGRNQCTHGVGPEKQTTLSGGASDSAGENYKTQML